MLDDNIPLALRTDLYAYLMQSQSAISSLTQVSAQANLELNGFSPEVAALAAGALGAAVGGVGKGLKADNSKISLNPLQALNGESVTNSAHDALNAKLSGLQSAQQEAAITRHLPDGRIRYYNPETPARTEVLLVGRHL